MIVLTLACAASAFYSAIAVGAGTTAYRSARSTGASATHATAAAALFGAGWLPLHLAYWGERLSRLLLRPRAAAHSAGAGPCTAHHGIDRVRYGCTNAGDEPAEPVEMLLTDLDATSRALRADVARRHLPNRPQPYATALAHLLYAVDDLRAGSADLTGKPARRTAPAHLFEHLYRTADEARMLVTDPEAGRG